MNTTYKNFRIITLCIAAGASLATLAAPVKVTGKVSNFGELPKDDILDAALVIPAMSGDEILSFQINKLLGPDETLSAGPINSKVPGNLFVPAQKERYGLITLTIKKESFSIFMNSGERHELAAIAVQSPFKASIEAARNKAPYTDLVPLVKFKKYSVGNDQDWSRVPSVDLPLNRNFAKTANFKWTRPAASSSQYDMALSFQKTQGGNWLPTDILGRISNTGMLQSGSSLKPEMKVLLVRVSNDAQIDPQSAVGWFRAGAPNATFSANGLPPNIQGASYKGDTISWSPIQDAGWMAILRDKSNALQSKHFESGPFGFLGGFGLKRLGANAESPLEAWVNPASGSYQLSNPILANESLTLLFIGADRSVPQPRIFDNDPALFTYAEQMRMLVLKK